MIILLLTNFPPFNQSSSVSFDEDTHEIVMFSKYEEEPPCNMDTEEAPDEKLIFNFKSRIISLS